MMADAQFLPSRIHTVNMVFSSNSRQYVPSQRFLFDRSSIAKLKISHSANVVCDGSPSRMRRVRRISLEITICPRSSTRRTIPVVFVYLSPFLWHPSAPSLRGLARASRDWGSVLFKNDTPSVFATLSHLPHRGRQGHLQYFPNCAVSICKLRSIIPQYLLFDFAVI